MVWLVDFHIHFSLPLSERADSKRAHQQRTLGDGVRGEPKSLLAPLLRGACVLLLNKTTVLFLNTEIITKSDPFLNTKNMLLSNTKNALFLNTKMVLLSNTEDILFWKKTCYFQILYMYFFQIQKICYVVLIMNTKNRFTF